MTANTALQVVMAAGQYFIPGIHRHRVLLRKHTRLSGHTIEGDGSKMLTFQVATESESIDVPQLPRLA